MGGRPESVHPSGARRPSRPGCVARAPRRVDGTAGRDVGGRPRRPGVHRRTARRRRSVRPGTALARCDRFAGLVTGRPLRPGAGRGRCGGGDRLVRAVARRHDGCARSQRRRHRELDVAGARGRPGRGGDRARRPDPEHPGVQRGVGARRFRLPLHPLPGGRRVPPHRVRPPTRRRPGGRPGRVGRARHGRDVAVGRPLTRRPLGAGACDGRLEPARRPRSRPASRPTPGGAT